MQKIIPAFVLTLVVSGFVGCVHSPAAAEEPAVNAVETPEGKPPPAPVTAGTDNPVSAATNALKEILGQKDNNRQSRLIAQANPLRPPGFPPMSQRELVDYWVLLGELALRQNDTKLAAHAYLQAALNSPSPKVAQYALSVASYTGDNDMVTAVAGRWGKLQPEDPRIAKLQAVAAIRNGDQQTAKQHLQSMVELADTDPDKGFELVHAVLQKGIKPAQAVKLMQLLVDDNPEVAAGHEALAALALSAGQYDLAESASTKAVALNPKRAKAQAILGTVLSAKNDNKTAAEHLGAAVELDPDNAGYRRLYTRVLLGNGDLEGALASADKVLESEPTNSSMLYLSGLASIDLKQIDKAQGYFERLRDSGQSTDEAHYYLAVIQDTKNNKTKARELYAKVANGGDLQLRAQLRIATLLAVDKQLDASLEQLKKVRLQFPEAAVRTWLSESQIHFEQRDYTKALAAIQQGLKLKPDNNDLIYTRALVFEKMDRIGDLEKDLLSILERVPDDARSLNALGYTLLNRTDRLEEAKDYIAKAIVLEPEDPAILDSMGWLLFKQEKYEESLVYLRKAYERFPDPEVAAHLGEVLWQQGQKEEALNIWNKALEKDPEHPVMKETVKRLNPDSSAQPDG